VHRRLPDREGRGSPLGSLQRQVEHAARCGSVAQLGFVQLDLSLVMKTLFTLVLWCPLFVSCWPIAVAVLVLWPVVWLVKSPGKA
jgi:hypothetical protein